MRRHAQTIVSTGYDALHGLLCLCSCYPLGECTIAARRDKREWTVSFGIDSPITEEPRRDIFPVHRKPLIRLHGLSPVGSPPQNHLNGYTKSPIILKIKIAPWYIAAIKAKCMISSRPIFFSAIMGMTPTFKRSIATGHEAMMR